MWLKQQQSGNSWSRFPPLWKEANVYGFCKYQTDSVNKSVIVVSWPSWSVFVLLWLVLIIFIDSLSNTASDWELLPHCVSTILSESDMKLYIQITYIHILSCIIGLDFFLKTALIILAHMYLFCFKNSMLILLIWHSRCKNFLLFVF